MMLNSSGLRKFAMIFITIFWVINVFVSGLSCHLTMGKRDMNQLQRRPTTLFGGKTRINWSVFAKCYQYMIRKSDQSYQKYLVSVTIGFIEYNKCSADFSCSTNELLMHYLLSSLAWFLQSAVGLVLKRL